MKEHYHSSWFYSCDSWHNVGLLLLRYSYFCENYKWWGANFTNFLLRFLHPVLVIQYVYPAGLPPKHPVWSCGLKTDDAHLAAHQWKQELFYRDDGAFPTDAEKWAWYGHPKSRMILFSYYLVSLTTLHLPKDIHHSSGCLEDSQILLSSFLNAR